MQPNILLLIVDSLRPDKFWSPNKTTITPNFDLLISSGTYFTQAISSSSSTRTAWGSILTGLFSIKNGMSGKSHGKLNSSITNYLDVFKKFGYHCFATIPNSVENIGLETYFENNNIRYPFELRLWSGLEEQINSTFSLIKKSEPWIYLIHLNDLHSPVYAPKEFNNVEFGQSQYDRVISSIDSWFGKLLLKLDLTKTCLVITSDHGDYPKSIEVNGKIINFEDGAAQRKLTDIGRKIPIPYELKIKLGRYIRNIRKNFKDSKLDDELSPYQKRALFGSRMIHDHRVFDDLLRIPLLFTGYKCGTGEKISSQVRHVDIFPTLVNISELPVGSLKNDGKNLLPIMHDTSVDLPVFIETPASIVKQSIFVIGVRTSEYKYFRNRDDKEKDVVLFDLKKDPFEEKNISDTHPELLIKFEKLLSEIINDQIDEENIDVMSDDEKQAIEDELKKQGYT